MQKSSSKELLKKLKKMYEKLENEKLSAQDLDKMVEYSQNLYERCLILRYKAIEQKVFGEKEIIVPQVESEEKKPKAEESTPEIDFGIFDASAIEKETAPVTEVEVKPEESIEVEEKEEVSAEETMSEPPTQESAVDEGQSEESPIEELEAKDEPAPSSTPASSGAWGSIFAQWTSEREGGISKKIEALPSSFGLNERMLYGNELFGGNQDEFARFINQLEQLQNWNAAAEQLAMKADARDWDKESNALKEFVHHIKRRYV